MEKEKFRCHPSIIIEKLAIFFLVIIFLIIYNFDDARMLIEGGSYKNYRNNNIFSYFNL